MARNVWNYKLWGHCKVRHHLLEIILWPNGDGTFRRIINEAKDLERLGIYDDYKLTIEITNSEHTTMHNHNRTEECLRKMSESAKGKPAWNKGLICPQFAGSNNAMYGKNAWAIACSRKTPEQIEATRQSKREKMSAFWASPEGQLKKKIMSEKIIETKRRKKEVGRGHNVQAIAASEKIPVVKQEVYRFELRPMKVQRENRISRAFQLQWN